MGILRVLRVVLDRVLGIAGIPRVLRLVVHLVEIIREVLVL